LTIKICTLEQQIFIDSVSSAMEKETNLSFGTVQLIHQKDLHFFLYRVSAVHEITP
jgi:hypothetical protein